MIQKKKKKILKIERRSVIQVFAKRMLSGKERRLKSKRRSRVTLRVAERGGRAGGGEKGGRRSEERR